MRTDGVASRAEPEGLDTSGRTFPQRNGRPGGTLMFRWREIESVFDERRPKISSGGRPQIDREIIQRFPCVYMYIHT